MHNTCCQKKGTAKGEKKFNGLIEPELNEVRDQPTNKGYGKKKYARE